MPIWYDFRSNTDRISNANVEFRPMLMLNIFHIYDHFESALLSLLNGPSNIMLQLIFSSNAGNDFKFPQMNISITSLEYRNGPGKWIMVKGLKNPFKMLRSNTYIFVIRTCIAMGKYIGLFKLLTFSIFHLLVTPPSGFLYPLITWIKNFKTSN